MSKDVENNVSLPIFGADAEDAWLFTEEKLSEMRAAAHKSATDAVARFLKSIENESSDSVAPSPGKKAKKELDLITLAEDLMLQVLKLSLVYDLSIPKSEQSIDIFPFSRTIICSFF